MPHYAIPYPTQLSPDDLSRFWSHVARGSGCRLWKGRADDYGQFYVRGGRQYLTHRLSYVLAYGPFDWALDVCHRCDAPGCVRPDHLFLGTAADNAHDAQRKGRLAAGERHRGVILTTAEVSAIRAALAAGGVTPAIAVRYGVAPVTVMAIKHRRLWSGVGDPAGDAAYPRGAARGERQGHAKLTTAQVRAIRDRYAAGGVSQRALACE